MKLKKVNASELHEMLCKGTVKFQFTKKDGTVRTAVGTLKSDLITRKPAGGENKVEGAGYTTYFDIEKDAFRCFAESKFIGIVEDYKKRKDYGFQCNYWFVRDRQGQYSKVCCSYIQFL